MCRLAVIDTAEQEALNFTLSGNMDQIMGIYVGFGDSMDHGHPNAMDLSIVSTGSTGHRQQFPLQQPSPQTLTWLQAAAQTTNIRVGLGGNTGHRSQHGLRWLHMGSSPETAMPEDIVVIRTGLAP